MLVFDGLEPVLDGLEPVEDGLLGAVQPHPDDNTFKVDGRELSQVSSFE